MQVNFTGFINSKAYTYRLNDRKNQPVLEVSEVNTELLDDDFYKFLSANINCGEDFFNKTQGSRCLSLKTYQYLDIKNPEWVDVFVNDKKLLATGKNYPMWDFLARFFTKMTHTPDSLFLVEDSYIEGQNYKQFFEAFPYRPKNTIDYLRTECTIFNPDEIKGLAYDFAKMTLNILEAFHGK